MSASRFPSSGPPTSCACRPAGDFRTGGSRGHPAAGARPAKVFPAGFRRGITSGTTRRHPRRPRPRGRRSARPGTASRGPCGLQRAVSRANVGGRSTSSRRDAAVAACKPHQVGGDRPEGHVHSTRAADHQQHPDGKFGLRELGAPARLAGAPGPAQRRAGPAAGRFRRRSASPRAARSPRPRRSRSPPGYSASSGCTAAQRRGYHSLPRTPPGKAHSRDRPAAVRLARRCSPVTMSAGALPVILEVPADQLLIGRRHGEGEAGGGRPRRHPRCLDRDLHPVRASIGGMAQPENAPASSAADAAGRAAVWLQPCGRMVTVPGSG